ncbi:hypothetical protein [Youngiibacter multivorans]|uniref:Tripartite tricarboxylate transporter TctB family protein n=1 Tax=Youngiibacter multivorans TaxID=937251 RepID=A0ABS4G6Q1_9CLOT|nr:hypothetical protein [Youngiibacter multivorans]MBP1919955.1 hypothetical protein [Youngiibacter multivorans]
MDNPENKLIKGLIVIFISLAAMAAAYLAYALFHTVIARITIPILGHPYPTVFTRPVFAGIMTILYLIYCKRGNSELAKAALISIPAGAFMLSFGIAFFKLPLVVIASKTAVFVIFLLILRRLRKDWTYYLALSVTYLLSMLY